MTNFTLNNHLKYSIGDHGLYNYRTNSYETYKISVGEVDPDLYRIGTYESELRRTADCVYREFGKDLVLFLSGGTDSEIVANNFLSIGIKPRCITIKFKNDYNADDVNEAVRLADKLGLKLEIIELDVHEFLNSGLAEEFGKEIQCTQITYIMVYYHILKYQAPAVMGGEALFTRAVNLDSSYWYYTIRENEDASAMRFTNKFGVPLVNEWFSYTPELLLHYMETPEMQWLFYEKENMKLTSVSNKNNVLRRLCPYATYKRKTHGFEKLMGFNFEAYKEIGRNQIKRLESCIDGLSVEETFKQLRAKIEVEDTMRKMITQLKAK
jgi:hypothetical protein